MLWCHAKPLSGIAEQAPEAAHLHFVTLSQNLITLCRIFRGFTPELSSTGVQPLVQRHRKEPASREARHTSN